jgi:hypothetical protein
MNVVLLLTGGDSMSLRCHGRGVVEGVDRRAYFRTRTFPTFD